jgi:hypothetical protein
MVYSLLHASSYPADEPVVLQLKPFPDDVFRDVDADTQQPSALAWDSLSASSTSALSTTPAHADLAPGTGPHRMLSSWDAVHSFALQLHGVDGIHVACFF